VTARFQGTGCREDSIAVFILSSNQKSSKTASLLFIKDVTCSTGTARSGHIHEEDFSFFSLPSRPKERRLKRSRESSKLSFLWGPGPKTTFRRFPGARQRGAIRGSSWTTFRPSPPGREPHDLKNPSFLSAAGPKRSYVNITTQPTVLAHSFSLWLKARRW